MAVEIKVMYVKKEEVQNTIVFWNKFAWELTSPCFKNGNEKTDETTDYTRLVFERDKDMPNYGRIAELEQQYIGISEKIPVKRFDNLKTFARNFSNDYRKRDERLVMNVIRIALLIAAAFAISKEALFIVFLIAFASTFIIGNGLKDKAFEDNIADSKSKVCKAYKKYLNNIFEINAINNELRMLRDISLEIKQSA